MEINKDIIYLAEDELARSYRWFRGEKPLNPAIEIVSIEKLQSLYDNGYVFLSNSQISAGQVLMRNPFQNREFIDINDSEERIIRTKIGAMSQIAQKLGARKISGHTEFLEEKSIERSADGSIKIKITELDYNYKKSQEEKYKKSYSLIREFPKAICTEESYSQAKQLIDENRLNQEIEVRDLVKLRNPAEINSLGKEIVKMSVSSEINTSKEFAASLLGSNIFSIGISTKNSISTLKSIIFTCEIEF